MGNVLEFYLKLKDMMSSGLAKVAKNGKEGFAQIEGAVKRVQAATDNSKKRNDILGQSYDALKRKAQQLESTISQSTSLSQIRQARKELAGLNSDMSKHAGNGDSGGGMFGGLLKRFAPLAIGGALIAGAGSFVKGSVEQYSNFEKNNKSYEVLAGNKGIGQALAGDLNSLKQNSILGASVYDNAKTMMSFGIGADKIIGNLKTLGEISMGDADRFGSLTLAFSQTQAAGKLMGQDLLQYVNAGFNPLNEISKMTGESMGVLRDKMQKGQITSKQVADAFEHATAKGGLFHGMLDQMSDTIAGKKANLLGKFAALQIAVGERFKVAVTGAVDGAIKLVTWLKNLVEIPVEQKLAGQITQIRALQAELSATTTSHQRQVEILHELENLNPNITKGISEQNIEYGKLAENINNVTGALEKKIFLESFTKSKSDTLSAYTEANGTISKRRGLMYSIIAQADPSLAQRTDLSFGQMQAAAMNTLQKKISSGNIKRTAASGGGAYGSYGSEEQTLLLQLRNAVSDNNKAVSVVNKLAPEVAEINKTKDALTAQIDKYTGVKSMSAAKLDGKPKTAGDVPGETDKAAKGITSGGPRVINIHGVNMKLADHLEVKAANADDLLNQLEPKLEDFWLRILNSGASVQ